MNKSENRAKIKEIFESVQGEGLIVGVKQIFIRFCSCNLHCNYCDTDFLPQNINDTNSFFDFTPDELVQHIKSNYSIDNIHSISLTGGEPLIWGEFLSEFLPKLKVKFYLETNGTISDNLKNILSYIDVIGADIKLPSCSGVANSFEMHNKFFNEVKNARIDCATKHHFNCDNKNIFAKIVFDDAITDDEIIKCCELGKKYNLELILQPKMIDDKPSVSTEFMLNILDKFLSYYKHTRLIPQVHCLLNIK